MSATRDVVSNLVGKSSFLACEFTEGVDLFDFERWRQTRSLSGIPRPCGCTDTMRGETKKGPRNIDLIVSCENGPSIRPASTSSSRYCFTVSGYCWADGWFSKMTVSVSEGISPSGKPFLRLVTNKG